MKAAHLVAVSLAVLVLLLLALGACTTSAVVVAVGPDRATVERALIAADDARRAILAGAPVALSTTYGGPALRAVSAEAAALRRRGERLESRLRARRLVHVAAAAGVLEVLDDERLVSDRAAAPAWSATAVQWLGRLARADAGWVVVDRVELAPPEWWR